MKTKFVLLLCSICAAALAGPSRPIQSSTFSVQTPCGPTHDPYAQQGQWFLNVNSGATNVNTREYHDEDNAMSISGVVQNIQFSNPANPYSNIMAFDILVTVSNTLPSDYQFGSASNSHNEVQSSTAVTPGKDTMTDVRITAEFAIPNIGVVPSGTPPYWPDPFSQGQYYIVAAGYDELAWYCWDPNQQNPKYQPAGAYQVPAWNLVPSTIPPGGTASVLMQFTVSGTGLPYNGGALGKDYRHGVLRYSQDYGADVLYNRYPSLKISHWLDTIVGDAGVTLTTPPSPYWDGEPIEYIYASDASVFYNDTADEEYPNKMHWPQLPDPNGWDVRACFSEQDGKQKILADDFRCTASGPITNITFWGSWFNDEFLIEDPFQGITNIHLSIHDDIPDPDGEGPEYSKPQLPARKKWNIDPLNLPANWNIVITPEEPSLQGWFDPNLPQGENFIPNNHSQYFRYVITIPEEEAFVQVSNTIYWLDVSMGIANGPQGETYLWGWKTTTNHWNDDAVFADMPVLDPAQWQELYEPPLFEQSLDLAFIIDGPDEQEPEYDWGDAPDSPTGLPPIFNTLAANNGANHTINMNYILGSLIDSELDGQPTASADGDDLLDGSDDEDGITFTSAFVPGQSVSFNATVSAAGQLDIWMDLNQNGAWNLPNEHVFSGGVAAGLNPLSFTVPIGTVPGQNYLRFRYTSSASAYAGGAPLPTGNASDGEVEDYTVNVQQLDWGDAPDSPYPTLAASSGANHLIGSTIYLGSLIDGEANGQPNITATGDDLATSADEDGVAFKTPFFPGTVAQIDVTAVGSGLLNIWIDFNVNGSWLDAGEQVYTDYSLPPGTTTLTLPVPTNAVPATNTYMRVRYSTVQSLQPTGYASDGEVEDYKIAIEDKIGVDWGDLPEPGYPVTAVNNGAHHIISSGLYLGATVDAEPDGQPSINADYDDINGIYPGFAYPPGDEDGVALTCARLMPGGYASVDVIASQPGILNAWLDFNLDSAWTQPGDQIFNNQPLVAGTNALLFPVPLTAAPGIAAHSRFRFTSGAGAYPGGTAVPTGLAYDGEVEDYHWVITAVPSGTDYGDAPDPSYPTLSGSFGAAHPIVAGVMLGATIDAETNGQPNATATGDDAHIPYSPTAFDDEDGVSFSSRVVAGTNASVDVVAGVSGGKLDAWVDFNADGDWNDSGEQIFASTPVGGGLNNLTFPVPQPSALGPTYARFRISSSGGLGVGGLAANGEVEDYTVELYQPAPTNLVITNLTFISSYSNAVVEWTVENGITYQMETSTNLTTNVWVDAGAQVVGPNNAQTNNMAAETNKFYRITVPWTP